MCQGQRPRQVGPSDSGRCGGLGACYDSSIGILAVADRLLHLTDQVWQDLGCLSVVRHREAGGLKDQDSRMDGQPHRDRGVIPGVVHWRPERVGVGRCRHLESRFCQILAV